MKRQRLFKLSIVFLIPLTLLIVLMAAAALASPAVTTDHNPAEFLPSAASDSPSIIARRAISIPFILGNSAPLPTADVQIVARRAISIPFIIDNSLIIG
jgi:hypothetical protein